MRSLLLTSILLMSACASTDPRCEDLCQVSEPGPFDRSTCSSDSVSSCIESCQARIRGVDTLCASCLLEGANFGSEGSPILLPTCNTDAACSPQPSCSFGGACTYCEGDTATQQSCFRETYPLTEAACSPSFRSVTECSTVCAIEG